MKKLLLGIFAMIVVLVSLISLVFASCDLGYMGAPSCPSSCPQPPPGTYAYLPASTGYVDEPGVVCLTSLYTCFQEYCPPGGTCSCVYDPLFSFYTKGTGICCSLIGGLNGCSDLNAGEGAVVHLRWGGDCGAGGGSYSWITSEWDADENELIDGCYYFDAGAAGTGISSPTLEGSEIPESSTKIVNLAEFSDSNDLQTTTETTDLIPLHQKATGFNGTYWLYAYPFTPVQPHYSCLYETYVIGGVAFWYWNCLIPNYYSPGICEYAACGADLACDEWLAGYYFYPYTCTEYGESYFADGCTGDCYLNEDSTYCRSSAFASGCTAHSNCNGRSPGATLSDSCGTNTIKLNRKCSSTCSYSDTTYTCDASTHSECQSVSCGGSTYYCTNHGGTWRWRTSSNPDRCGGNSDGCYPYSNGCEIRDYKCSGGSCTNSVSNRNTDSSCSYTGCSGDLCDRTGTWQDYYCDAGSCSPHATSCSEPCAANNYCSGGSCGSGSCGSSGCPADYCDGTNTFYDYPASCNRYCDGSGSCQSCTCTATPTTCSASGCCVKDCDTTNGCHTEPGTCSDLCGTNVLQTGGSCSGCGANGATGTCNFANTYTCDASTHTNCQSETCSGTKYCTYDGSTWEWRASYPGEVCNDGEDNDCDSLIDAEDTDCMVGVKLQAYEHLWEMYFTYMYSDTFNAEGVDKNTEITAQFRFKTNAASSNYRAAIIYGKSSTGSKDTIQINLMPYMTEYYCSKWNVIGGGKTYSIHVPFGRAPEEIFRTYETDNLNTVIDNCISDWGIDPNTYITSIYQTYVASPDSQTTDYTIFDYLYLSIDGSQVPDSVYANQDFASFTGNIDDDITDDFDGWGEYGYAFAVTTTDCTPGNDIICHTTYPSGSCDLTCSQFYWDESTCGSHKVCKEYYCAKPDADVISYNMPSGTYARSDTISIPYTVKNVEDITWCFLTESDMIKSSGSHAYPGKWNSVSPDSTASDTITYTVKCDDPTGTWSANLGSYTDAYAKGGWNVWYKSSESFQVVQCLNDADCEACKGSCYDCNTGTHTCYYTCGGGGGPMYYKIPY